MTPVPFRYWRTLAPRHRRILDVMSTLGRPVVEADLHACTNSKTRDKHVRRMLAELAEEGAVIRTNDGAWILGERQ